MDIETITIEARKQYDSLLSAAVAGSLRSKKEIILPELRPSAASSFRCLMENI
jgi:hypothetical protein